MRPTTYWTWILPSSRQLGFLHLIIHVRYVRGQTMLNRCCFAITVMVDTISFTSSRNSLKFPSIIGTVHHVFLQHLDFYSDHAMLFPAQVWGGDTWEFHLSLLLCIVCVCSCIFFWLISLYLWLALVFLFNRVYYGFTPLRHHTSRHYMSRHLSCSSCLLGLIYGLRWLYAIRDLRF